MKRLRLRRVILLRNRALNALNVSCLVASLLILARASSAIVVVAFVIGLISFGVWFSLLFYVYELESDIAEEELE